MDSGNQSNCSVNVIFPYQRNIVIPAIKAATGGLLIVLSAVAIAINVVYQKYRFPFHRMVLLLSIATLLEGVTSLLNGANYYQTGNFTNAFCSLAGFLSHYSFFAELLAILCLSFSLFVGVACGERVAGKAKCFAVAWPLFVFVFPLSFLWVPFVLLAYGRSDFESRPWCEIRTRNSDLTCSIFQFGFGVDVAIWTLGFALSALLVVSYICLMTVVQRRRQRGAESAHHKKQLRKETLAAGVFIAVFLVGTIVRLVNEVVLLSGVFVSPLWIVSAFYSSSHGVVIVILSAGGGTICRNIPGLLLCNRIWRRAVVVKEFQVKETMEASAVTGACAVVNQEGSETARRIQ